MPSPSFPPCAPPAWIVPRSPAASPSWVVAGPEGWAGGRARAGQRWVLPALPWLSWPDLPLSRLSRLAREVMLGAVLGMGAGWAVALLAVRLGF
ncbi:hypothetical protein NON00_10950 [Roseomonas sp. GC11]|uniref:hypothetical protein n=1 Tax=Roseomonas sp. GC11 TaxID=2950546 RepID=UPI00210D4A2F|nr:hypothetical protein [Roseomonas sp. GC11]MCQ4160446.1 hypothetical protein [Roseomonas sp. GC11]